MFYKEKTFTKFEFCAVVGEIEEQKLRQVQKDCIVRFTDEV